MQDLTKGPYGVSLSGVFAPTRQLWRVPSLVLLAAVFGTVVIWLRNSRNSGCPCRHCATTRSAPPWPASRSVRVRTTAWLLSALVAGLMGGVFAWQISVFYPETAFDLSISIFAIVFTLFGGAGTLTRSRSSAW